MTPLQFSRRVTARRLAAIDAYEFPVSVRGRFVLENGFLSADDVRKVEAAARQWFRVAARRPRARLAMPSVVVDGLWHEMVLHTRDYAEFCAAAFGHFLHHTPGPAGERGSGLVTAFRLAQQDEGDATGRLPLLFRVDAEVGVPGGRRYLADCGGRGQCHDLPGAVCLQHVDGLGRALRVQRGQGRVGGAGPVEDGGWVCGI